MSFHSVSSGDRKSSGARAATALIGLLVVRILFTQELHGQGLAASAPSVEYIRSGDRVLATIRAPQPTFSDTTFATTTHRYFADRLWDQGITNGCYSSVFFCPELEITRGQMSAFLIRGLNLALRGNVASDAPYTRQDWEYPFTDAPVGHPFYPFIRRMWELGITNGCGPTTYCPDSPTTNGQMAVFAVRVRQVVQTSPSPGVNGAVNNGFTDSPTTPYFGDVLCDYNAPQCGDSWNFFKWIQKARQLNFIRNGCGTYSNGLENFCGAQNITRGRTTEYVVRGILNDFTR